jgi:phosphoserine phosphatase
MADDTDDRAAMLAEAYKRGILPPEVKSQYEEAMKRGLVKSAEPSKFAKSMDDQRKPDSKLDRFGTGIKDPLVGLGQLERHMVGMIPGVPKSVVSDADEYVKNRETEIAKGAPEGTDWMRMAGNVASPMNYMPLGNLAKAGTVAKILMPEVRGAVGGLMRPATGENFVEEKLEQGAAGAALGRAGQIGGNALARVLTPEARAVEAAAAANPKFQAARQAGYVVHPADATSRPGAVADAASGLGGKIKTQQAASVKNQVVTNKIAAQELGLPPDATLDEATFNAVRGRAANAYKTIEQSASKLPSGKIVADNAFLHDISSLDARSADFAQDFPEAAASRSAAVKSVQDAVLKQEFSPKAGVEMIRNLRDDARVNLKNWGDADKVRLGTAQRDAANAMESLIERELTKAGDPQAVAEYRAARQMIAKAHDVESVTDAAGNVDARRLAALGNRRPLSGGLKTIADTAETFGKSMQNPAKFGGPEKISVMDIGAMIASTTAALASGHAAFAAGAAAPLARPFARSLALSEMLQNRLAGLGQQPGRVVGAIPEQQRNALAAMLRKQSQYLAPGAGAAVGGAIDRPPP